jgi:predicted DNA-binding transcriptional regulator YafY
MLYFRWSHINLFRHGLAEIKRWVLGMGPEAFVIAPEELKDMVQADLERSLDQYQQGQLFLAKEPVEKIRDKRKSS